MKDKCGIVGIYSKSGEVSRKIYYGLYALQHRGQESAGISTYDGGMMFTHKGMGLVVDVFKEDNFEALKGNKGIGHVRYSTSGKSLIENSSPFVSEYEDGYIAIAHNGDIINSTEIRKELESEGRIFYSTTDSEVLCHLMIKEYTESGDIIKAIQNVSKDLIGSYSLAILMNNDLIVVRDSGGIKPLSLGKKDDLIIVASESVAFDVIGAEKLRDVEPGEILLINDELKSFSLPAKRKIPRSYCMFEYIYFARPDSIIDGKNVYDVRLNIGRALHQEHAVEADMVIPVPDSAITAAIGYSRESGLPYGEGLIKNRYVGRTFIMPTQEDRENSVRLKMNPIKSELEGKKIVMVDDSVVRGTTSKALMDVLKEAGANEIHLRVGCPPIISPCYYGIAMASKKELIASDKEVKEIERLLGVDSLGYLSIESLIKCIGIDKDQLCTGCFTGEYPTSLPKNIEKYESSRC